MHARVRIMVGVTLATVAAGPVPGLAAQAGTSAQQKAAAPPQGKAPAASSRGTGGAQPARQAPRFTVDYAWPKPLPTHKLLGSVTGLAVDRNDHVFVVHRMDSFTPRTETGGDANPPIAECCFSEQPVIEFDAAGNRIKSWGGPGPGYEWPLIPGGIAIDPKGNVWIAGSGGLDGQVLVFTHDGSFIRQIGKAGRVPAPAAQAPDTAYQGVSPGGRGAAGGGGGRGGRAGGDSTAGRGGGFAVPVAGRAGAGGRGRGAAAPMLPPNSSSTEMFGGATRIAFSADGATAFIADGTRNRRVVEVDVATGAIRKFWGAYGNPPSDAATPAYSPDAAASQQFSGVACVKAAKDGMLYVCDRANNRIQVFKLDGSFVKEAKVAPATLGEGAVWDVAFSADAAQRFLYVADGMNAKVRILERATLQELTNFGDGGRIPGTFYALHSLAVDSKGNLYTGETLEGKRVQKFGYGGVGPVTRAEQGILWPARAAK